MWSLSLTSTILVESSCNAALKARLDTFRLSHHLRHRPGLATICLLAMIASVETTAEILDPQPSLVQEPDKELLIETLEDYQTFSAVFALESIDENLQPIAEQTGGVYFVRPDLFAWNIDPPDEQVGVVDAGTVTLYDATIEQVSYMYLEDLSGTEVFKILMDPRLLRNPDYSVVKGEDSFLIRSSSNQDLPTQIEVKFTGNVMSGIRVHDHLGGRTDFSFNDVILNERIDRRVFEIEIPEGTDTVGEKPSQSKPFNP